MNSNLLWIARLKFNENGLIPAIAQDYQDGAVLMMAWMNKESIEQTLATKEAHYWSRSRSELWHKGATSGHIQKVKSVYYDCDADTLLYHYALTLGQVAKAASTHSRKLSNSSQRCLIDNNRIIDI